MENKFKGQALNYWVIVEEVLNENKTKSGFDMSGYVDANEHQKKGRIVSIGEACPKLSNGEGVLKIGDEVIFNKLKTTDFTQNAVKYIMVMYSDIAIVL